MTAKIQKTVTTVGKVTEANSLGSGFSIIKRQKNRPRLANNSNLKEKKLRNQKSKSLKFETTPPKQTNRYLKIETEQKALIIIITLTFPKTSISVMEFLLAI